MSQRLFHSLSADQIFRAPNGRASVSFPCEEDTAVYLPLCGSQLRRQLLRDLHESRDEYPSAGSLSSATPPSAAPTTTTAASSSTPMAAPQARPCSIEIRPASGQTDQLPHSAAGSAMARHPHRTLRSPAASPIRSPPVLPSEPDRGRRPGNHPKIRPRSGPSHPQLHTK